jgi:predicted transcriptional regulator
MGRLQSELGSGVVSSTLRLPEDLAADVDRLAARVGKSKNRWIVDALMALIYGGEERTIPRRVEELEARVAVVESANEDMERRLGRLEDMAYGNR